MAAAVEVVFDCLPFRLVGHSGMPLDASEEQLALWRRFRAAMERHGVQNTYFLYNADCSFQLSNGSGSRVRFVFEATVRTDGQDSRPTDIDLVCHLADCDFPEPLMRAAAEFWREAVRRAVLDEFQRFIDDGNLRRTLAQREHVLRAWDRNRGFVGMDI